MGAIQTHITGLLLLLVIATGAFMFINGFIAENNYSTTQLDNATTYFNSLNRSQSNLINNTATLRNQITSGLERQDFLSTIFTTVTAGSFLVAGTLLGSVDASVQIIQGAGTLLAPYSIVSDVFTALVAIITIIVLLNFLFSIIESFTKTKL